MDSRTSTSRTEDRSTRRDDAVPGQRRDQTSAPPGADADKPTEIPPKGWLDVAKRAWRETKADQVPLLAAGVAFWSFLALFPAMIAAVMVYGLFADPATVSDQAEEIAAALPSDAASVITDQLNSIATTSSAGLGLGLLVSLAAALWSASGGVNNLMTAVNIAYDEEQDRGFVKQRGLALALTVGAIVFVLVAISLIAVVPVVLEAVLGGGALYWLLQALRWVGLVVAVMVGLAVLYRVAPDRDDPQMSWVSVGAVMATVAWVAASVVFSLYVSNFGSYGKTYGALAGVVVLMLWLFITAFLVLFGAEVNAEAEQQSRHDTTTGDPEPMGQRGAVKADTPPERADAD